MDARRLRVLLAVAEHGSVAEAARALSFTPPAVSQQVAALERQLGLTLLDRTQRRARLTPVGERLVAHARSVLAALETAEAEVRAWSGEVEGVVRVGAIPTLAKAVLPRVFRRLAGRAPALELRIEQLEPEQSLRELARGELDLVLAGEYALAPRRPVDTLERHDLASEDVLVAVPNELANGEASVELSALRAERWIAPAPQSSCAVLLERSCAIAGFEPHVVSHCGDFDVALALVAAGVGIALVPRVAAAPPAGVSLLRVQGPEISRVLYASVRTGSLARPALRAVLDAVQGELPSDR